MTPDRQQYYSSAETAAVLGVCRATVWHKIQDGTLHPVVDERGAYRYLVREVHAYKRWRAQGHTGAPDRRTER